MRLYYLKIKLRGATSKISLHNNKWGQVKVIIGTWNHQTLMWRSNCKQIFSGFCVQTLAIVSEDLIVIGS